MQPVVRKPAFGGPPQWPPNISFVFLCLRPALMSGYAKIEKDGKMRENKEGKHSAMICWMIFFIFFGHWWTDDLVVLPEWLLCQVRALWHLWFYGPSATALPLLMTLYVMLFFHLISAPFFSTFFYWPHSFCLYLFPLSQTLIFSHFC